LFGPAGNLILAVIIGLACLTTCCGIASGAAWYFNKLFKNKISYERLLLVIILFSFAASNIGLTQIITLAVPFLVTIYPVVIVLVVLSLLDRFIGWRRSIYQWACDITLAFAVVDGLNAAGIHVPVLNAVLADYVPFYSIMMGWLLPAIVGAVIGWVVSLFRTAPSEEAAKE
jgi:LIVCS family branched-chain amino acid:cation transporter